MKTYNSSKGVAQGTSLVVQWVRLCAPNAGDLGSIPVRGTRSCMHAATKSSHAATKSLHVTTKSPHAATKSPHAATEKDPACHN